MLIRDMMHLSGPTMQRGMMFKNSLFLRPGNEKRANHQGGRAQEIN